MTTAVCVEWCPCSNHMQSSLPCILTLSCINTFTINVELRLCACAVGSMLHCHGNVVNGRGDWTRDFNYVTEGHGDAMG